MINHKMKNLTQKTNLVSIFFILSLSILFVKCEKDPDDFGKEFITPRDSIGVLVDTNYNLKTYLEREDTFSTSFRSNALVGNMMDPYFGQVNAEFMARFEFSNLSNFDSTKVYEPDSSEIEIVPSSSYGVAQQLEFSVYKVSQELSYETTVFSNDSASLYYDEADLVSLNSTYENDSLYRLEGTMDFTNFLFEKTMEKLENDTLSLSESLNGLYFKTNKFQTQGGAILTVPSTSVKVKLYYSEIGMEDTSYTQEYRIYSYAGQYPISFNLFSHDYQNNLSPGINAYERLNDQDAEDSLLFVNSLQGTKVRVKLPDVDSIRSDYADKLMSSVYLRFDLNPEYNEYKEPKNMVIYVQANDSVYQRMTTEPEGTLDSLNNQMNFDITSFYQGMVKGESDVDELFIHLSDSKSSYNQTILSGSTNASPARLEIKYYNTSK